MKKTWKDIKSHFSDLLYLAYPDLCLICGTSLINDEPIICYDCLYKLPLTAFQSYSENPAAERFYGKIKFSYATAAFHYQKGSVIQIILEALKYKGESKVGDFLGSYSGQKLMGKGFFDSIDLIVPVPLHQMKLKSRGFNQSEIIAKGLSKACNIEVDCKTLLRKNDNKTQTTRNIYDRWKNVSSIFTVENKEVFMNKHILLVDDVLTSGSTLEACGQKVLESNGSQISFFALALA